MRADGKRSFGASDCERIRPGPLAQPFNACSSLVLVAAGVHLARESTSADAARRPELISFAARVAGAGAGSFLYHGPQPRLSAWAHDASVMALLLHVLVYDLARVGLPPARARALLAASSSAAGAVTLLLPRTRRSLLGSLAALTAVAELSVRRALPPARRRVYRGSLGALGLGLIAQWAGRTGGPLCDPNHALQPHGMWHVLAAVAAEAYARSVVIERASDGPIPRVRSRQDTTEGKGGRTPWSGPLGHPRRYQN